MVVGPSSLDICTYSIIMGSKPFYISNLNSFTRLYCIHFYTLCINMRRFCKMQDYENSNAKSLSLWPQCLLHTAISSYFVHASTFFVHCLNYQVWIDVMTPSVQSYCKTEGRQYDWCYKRRSH